jgi:hypothetical protein
VSHGEHGRENPVDGNVINGEDLRACKLPAVREIASYIDLAPEDRSLERNQRLRRHSLLNGARGAKRCVSALDQGGHRRQHPIELQCRHRAVEFRGGAVERTVKLVLRRVSIDAWVAFLKRLAEDLQVPA